MDTKDFDSITKGLIDGGEGTTDLSGIFSFENLLIVIFAALFAILLLRKLKRKKNPEELTRVRQKKTINIFGRTAIFSSKFFITRRRYNRVREQVANLYPSSTLTIENETGKILFYSYIWAFLCLVAAVWMLIIAGFDLFYGIACVFAGIVLMDMTINSRLAKIKEDLLVGEQKTMQDIRHLYHQEKMIDVAVNRSIELATPIMLPHLNDIFRILTSPKMMQESEEYKNRGGDKHLSVFLQLCVSTKENGDRTAKDGKSVFLTSLGHLKEKVDADILHMRKTQIAFKGLTLITLFPLLGIKLLESWATENMPTISQYYQGIYSTVAVMVTFVVTYIIYSVIEMLKSDSESGIRNESVYSRLAKREPFSSVFNRIINRRYNKYLRIDSEMRAIGDHTGAKAFLMKRTVYAVIGFMMGLLVTIGGTYVGKSDLLDDYYADFAEIKTVTPEYKESMYTMAGDMIKEHLKDDITEEELTAEIKEYYQTTTLTATQVAASVIEHKTEYLDRYYRWWYLVISIIVGLVAAYVPVALLRLNARTIDARRQDEVMEYQTLMLIMMHIPGMSVGKVLEWLEKFSSIFLEDIITCRAELGAGQEKALLKMRDSESFEPFRSFCDCLLGVDRSGLEDAFSEVESEHAYFMKQKEINRDADLVNKKVIAKDLALVPMWLVMGFYLLIPMFRYAMEMFSMFKTATNF